MASLMVTKDDVVFGFSQPKIDFTMKDYTVVSFFSECKNVIAHERSSFNVMVSKKKIDLETLRSQFTDLNKFSFDVCESTDMFL